MDTLQWYPLKELDKTEYICKWKNYTRIKVLRSLFELLEYKLKASWEIWYLKFDYRDVTWSSVLIGQFINH